MLLQPGVLDTMFPLLVLSCCYLIQRRICVAFLKIWHMVLVCVTFFDGHWNGLYWQTDRGLAADWLWTDSESTAANKIKWEIWTYLFYMYTERKTNCSHDTGYSTKLQQGLSNRCKEETELSGRCKSAGIQTSCCWPRDKCSNHSTNASVRRKYQNCSGIFPCLGAWKLFLSFNRPFYVGIS